MDIADLRAFLTIAQLGTFTRAAAALHLSQPALSRRIRLVEQTLGAAVFERTARGIHLTEVGSAFLPYAEATIASLQDAREAAREVANGICGCITLAFVGTLGNTALTESLRRFRKAQPGIELVVRTATSLEVTGLVRRGDATLGLRYQGSGDPTVMSRVVGREVMVVVASRHHRLAGKTHVNPRQLAEDTWITFPKHPAGEGGFALLLDQYRARYEMHGAHQMFIDSLTAQKRLIEAEFGIGLVPESSVIEELRAGTVRVLRVPTVRPTIPIVLIQRRGGHTSGAARLLSELLAEAFASTTSPSLHPMPARLSRDRDSGHLAERDAAAAEPA